MLSQQSRSKLLDVAKEAVEAAVNGQPAPDAVVDEPELQEKRGAFVTIKTDARLRGCLGRFVSNDPLWKTVRDLAAAAATEDPRFLNNRLRPDELDRVEVEVSVLSPMKKSDDPLNDIETGKHGVYVRKGARTGCFLPQVATETGWDTESFLENCCAHKAGLPPRAWDSDPEAEVFIFTAEVVGP